MAGIRGQALAHLDKSFENDKLSSGGKGSKANKQKLSSSSPSSPSSSTTATPANAAAPTSTHDRNIAEKSLFSSASSAKRASTGNSTVSSSSLHSKSSAQSSVLHNNNNKEYKDISRMISTSLMTTGAFLGSTNTTTTTATSTTGRGRSSSSASVNSTKSNKSKNSVDSSTPSNHSHHHHHIRLPSLPLHTPSFLKRRKQQGNATASLDSISSSLPPHLRTNSSSSLSSPVHKPDPHPHHAILMVPQHDIHIAFPHPVPSHNVFIAGTWTVPGHQPWEKLPMTHIPETDTFEITLNVQELEDISDYLDEDGYLHHELLDHPPEEHHHEEESHSATTTAPTRISKRQRIRRFFGRARSSSSSSTTSPPTHDKNNSAEHINSIHKHEDTAYHHQSKDGMPLPLSKEYRYQYKFVVDDEWLCDPQRPQVHDGHGHWNHELVVVLMEQNPTLDTTHELLNRSRSSSTAESSVYSKPLPIPVVEISEHKEEKEKEDEKMEVIMDEETKDIPDQSSNEVSMAAVAVVPRPAKAKETYEAVLLFEERDDLSDGEGRSKSQALSEDEEDDQDEITSEAPAADHDQNHTIGHTVEVEEVENENKESEEAVEIESKSLPVDVDEPEVEAVPTSSAFVLLAAADPEEHTHTTTTTSVLEEEEIQDPRTTPSSMQILTDATTLATGVRLLSPPLTPTSVPLADADKDMETPVGMMSPESDSESSFSKELPSTFMGTFALLTPRTESSPFTRVSYEADTTRSLEAAIVAHESKQEQEAEANEHETFDVLDDHSSLRSSRYSSSSSLSSMGSSMVEARHDRSRSEEERKGLQPPEKYPNLLWSFCKTTVVVSAAVVVLSLGLGRKRD
ncbi:hypothetical protein EMPS_11337 [Entomortierella parvispora]|uniref:AMP-activated protein kinase glycogen-binding domain-containing protein n=1 Tax=Entomortierella parvispora TaxID=205924 RepID=A0A9P3HMH2_9FUNG|nr:hypothetical protein EMPS_11337 [Entomortierella parvispora]